MDNKEFETKLDDYSEKISKAVAEGVDRMEKAFEKGREELRKEKHGQKSKRARRGAILIGLGVVWLLYALGALGHPLLPILLIILGIYLIVRDRDETTDTTDVGGPPPPPTG